MKSSSGCNSTLRTIYCILSRLSWLKCSIFASRYGVYLDMYITYRRPRVALIANAECWSSVPIAVPIAKVTARPIANGESFGVLIPFRSFCFIDISRNEEHYTVYEIIWTMIMIFQLVIRKLSNIHTYMNLSTYFVRDSQFVNCRHCSCNN